MATRKNADKSLSLRMKETLQGSKFRWLNEQLYTRTGYQSFQLFQSDPVLFSQVRNVSSSLININSKYTVYVV